VVYSRACFVRFFVRFVDAVRAAATCRILRYWLQCGRIYSVRDGSYPVLWDIHVTARDVMCSVVVCCSPLILIITGMFPLNVLSASYSDSLDALCLFPACVVRTIPAGRAYRLAKDGASSPGEIMRPALNRSLATAHVRRYLRSPHRLGRLFAALRGACATAVGVATSTIMFLSDSEIVERTTTACLCITGLQPCGLRLPPATNSAVWQANPAGDTVRFERTARFCRGGSVGSGDAIQR